MNITLNSSVRLCPDLLFCDAGGEAIILSESTGKYYGLNGVGMRLWRALEQDGSLARAYAAVLEEYDADPAELEQDLLSFVRDLAALKLVALQP